MSQFWTRNQMAVLMQHGTQFLTAMDISLIDLTIVSQDLPEWSVKTLWDWTYIHLYLPKDLTYVALLMAVEDGGRARNWILITKSRRHASIRSAVPPLLILMNATTAHTVICFAILMVTLVKMEIMQELISTRTGDRSLLLKYDLML